MKWRQTKQNKWEVAEQGFTGHALLKETNSGYIVIITVENTDFDMELLNERDFFERKKDALKFLREKMEQESY